MTIVQSMNLNSLETAALRLAIARDDPTIRQSLEAFRASRNEHQLISALRRVASEIIDETVKVLNQFILKFMLILRFVVLGGTV